MWVKPAAPTCTTQALRTQALLVPASTSKGSEPHTSRSELRIYHGHLTRHAAGSVIHFTLDEAIPCLRAQNACEPKTPASPNFDLHSCSQPSMARDAALKASKQPCAEIWKGQGTSWVSCARCRFRHARASVPTGTTRTSGSLLEQMSAITQQKRPIHFHVQGSPSRRLD